MNKVEKRTNSDKINHKRRAAIAARSRFSPRAELDKADNDVVHEADYGDFIIQTTRLGQRLVRKQK